MKGKKTNIIFAITLSLVAAIAGIVIFLTWDINAETAQLTSQPSQTADPIISLFPATAAPSASQTEAVPASTPSASPVSTESDATTYTIENERFAIDSTGQNARATTDGINAALKWAKEQGYRNIKFAEGTYLIQCKWGDRFTAPTDGILVPSDLILDLGNSTFIMEPNSDPEYVIFGVVSQSNVTIKNGTIVGDLESHTYAPSENSPTHEYGFGICISSSKNVLIQGVTIKNMIGDGIIVEGSYTKLADGGSVSSEISVIDCDISLCRRNGISLVGATGSEIAGNRIYDISGTAPGYGIIMMTELDYIIDGLSIHDNMINNCAGGSISCNTGNNFDVSANTCNGNILVALASNVKIYGNTIQNGFIEVMQGSSNVTVEDNILDEGSTVKIDKANP